MFKLLQVFIEKSRGCGLRPAVLRHKFSGKGVYRPLVSLQELVIITVQLFNIHAQAIVLLPKHVLAVDRPQRLNQIGLKGFRLVFQRAPIFPVLKQNGRDLLDRAGGSAR